MRQRAQPWLGTLVNIAIDGASSDQEADQACNRAFGVIGGIHALMSFHEAGSDVSRINRAGIGDMVEIHPWTAEVLQAALRLTADTRGIFDIACASRLAAWGYLPQLERMAPAYCAGKPVFAFETAASIRKIAPGWIDLGGIAKGYAVDRAIQLLEEQGIAAACVNAGGDLRAFGDMDFPVLIRDPSQPSHMRAKLTIRNRALATSANYFTAKEIEGRKISALIDGRDGQSVNHDKSISVLAPTCMVADALTKYIAVINNPADPLLTEYGATALII